MNPKKTRKKPLTKGSSPTNPPRRKVERLEKLEPRFEQPKGWQWGTFASPNGGTLRYGHVKPRGQARGTVVILPGRTEFAEKYFEAIHELTKQGFEVWTMDWYGQGGSERHLPNRFKDHKNDYAEDVSDLHHFMTHICKPDNDGPIMMSAHSMGAHKGIRYLHDHPGVFACAALTSPMLGINTAPFPNAIARRIAALAVRMGRANDYVLGGNDNPAGRGNYHEEKVSTDPIRRKVHNYWTRKKPELALGSPTNGWLHESFKSIDIVMQDDYLKAIKTPILIGIGMDDTVVDIPAQQHAASILPNARSVEIDGARHEIWMESDAKRGKWLKAFTDFADQYVPPRQNTSATAKKKPQVKKRRRFFGLW